MDNIDTSDSISDEDLNLPIKPHIRTPKFIDTIVFLYN